ncbi:MAG: lipoyl(octanoyl) transferase LipB [Candidatus Omnitrophota bacterium]
MTGHCWRIGNMGIEVIDLGLVSYEEAIRVQEDLLEERASGRIEDTILMLEHPPVVTLGRSASRVNIRNERFFEERGIQIVASPRGGGITYHSPGQLIVYPVIRLEPPFRDVSGFIDVLEEAAVQGLDDLGVRSLRAPGKRGVWAGGKKIAFIGIKLRKWITCHGAAININNDVLPFEMIDPCGEAEIKVTSASIINGADLDMKNAKKVFARRFSEVVERSVKNAV